MDQKPRKKQDRTAVTRDSLLAAAEKVFAQVGYEMASVDQIAIAAGFSKGGLYAHFKSKEDLFLALYGQKTAAYQTQLRNALDTSADRKATIQAFKTFYVDLSKDRDWALILLEMKLFVRRHPEVGQRIRQIDEQDPDSMERVIADLFGPAALPAGEALGGIFSALVLESDLHPALLPEPKMREILATIFDTLLSTPI